MPLYVFKCPNNDGCDNEQSVEVITTEYFTSEEDAKVYATEHNLRCKSCETKLVWNPFGGSSSFRLNFKPL